jgi:hypothetical protein
MLEGLSVIFGFVIFYYLGVGFMAVLRFIERNSRFTVKGAALRQHRINQEIKRLEDSNA